VSLFDDMAWILITYLEEVLTRTHQDYIIFSVSLVQGRLFVEWSTGALAEEGDGHECNTKE
jgi:hypothetical protein